MYYQSKGFYIRANLKTMNILVPIDFSTNSIKALEFAVGLHRGSKTKIILCHVIEMIYDFASQTALAMDNMHADARKNLKSLAKKYSIGSIEVHSEIIEGTPSINIARLAEESNADLIIMGTHGMTGLKKVLVGSTGVNVIRESSIPVLLVPEESSTQQITHISFALEVTDQEEKFIKRINRYAGIWDIKIQLLHISKSKSFVKELALEGLKCYFEQNTGYQPRIHQLESENVLTGINEFLEESPESMLAMCHTQKSVWDQLLGKRKSIEMAYQVRVPLLVLV
jgi:nucleotide-binding universal stress UspA family protein